MIFIPELTEIYKPHKFYLRGWWYVQPELRSV